MRSTFKRILSLLIACTIMTMACSGFAFAEIEKWDTDRQDEIIVTVINGFYTAGEKKLAEEYMKLHPETKVTIDVVADNDSYIAKMQALLSSEDETGTSDIIHTNFMTHILGSASVAFEQGYLLDFTQLLDQEHPYQDGLIRDMYDPIIITEALNAGDGVGINALPFDKLGISFYYNKTLFEKYGLSAPKTWEDLLAICATFADNGYAHPITLSTEGIYILASIADAGFRKDEIDLLVQPGDALFEEETMSDNVDFVFDENNLDCDAFTVRSRERFAALQKNGIILSDTSAEAWKAFLDLAKYFPENWVASGADSATEFEMQNAPIMINGSWNVGLILDDMNQMPENARFDWATFKIPAFANPPEGFASSMRGLYVLGNQMGIIPKSDPDHNARVIDFYMYWYSMAGAQKCYEETLANGNYVQGPSIIKGVTLTDALNEKLLGFVEEGSVKEYMSSLIGMDQTTEADKPLYRDIVNKATKGEMSIDDFLVQLNEITGHFVDEQIKSNNWDLDPAT